MHPPFSILEATVNQQVRFSIFIKTYEKDARQKPELESFPSLQSFDSTSFERLDSYMNMTPVDDDTTLTPDRKSILSMSEFNDSFAFAPTVEVLNTVTEAPSLGKLCSFSRFNRIETSQALLPKGPLEMVKADLYTIFPNIELEESNIVPELLPVEAIETMDVPEVVPEPNVTEPLIPKVVNTLVNLVWGSKKEETPVKSTAPDFGMCSHP